MKYVGIVQNAYQCVGIIILLILLSCEREISVSPPDEPPPNGCLVILSNPSDAQIYLNNKNRRRTTPDSLTWLETGEYTITLKKDLWLDTSVSVNVTEGDRTELNVDYMSNPAMFGSLMCSSRPANASIIIDGIETDQLTPSTIEMLTPGYHTVRIELPNHQSIDSVVTIRSSELTQFYSTLVDTAIWKVYSMESAGFPTNNLTSAFIDSEDRLWVGTLTDGILKYESGNWINYRATTHNIASDYITSFCEDKWGYIWVGGMDGILEISKDNVFLKINKNNFPRLPSTKINDIDAAGGSVWFATENGFFRYVRYALDNKWWDVTQKDNSTLPENGVIVVKASTIVKWVATQNSGIIRFSNSQHLQFHNTSSGLFSNSVSDLEIDKNGLVWVGHFGTAIKDGGLSMYDGINWSDQSYLVYHQSVRTIFVDSKNLKWISTDNALCVIINSYVRKKFDYDNTGLNCSGIVAITEDSSGNIYFATEKSGLIKLIRKKLSIL